MSTKEKKRSHDFMKSPESLEEQRHPLKKCSKCAVTLNVRGMESIKSTDPRSNPRDLHGNIKDNPGLWATEDITTVLHAVYHDARAESFTPIEQPHWFFVRRMSSLLVAELNRKNEEIKYLENQCKDLRLQIRLANHSQQGTRTHCSACGASDSSSAVEASSNKS
jgi:hypothetical protein